MQKHNKPLFQGNKPFRKVNKGLFRVKKTGFGWPERYFRAFRYFTGKKPWILTQSFFYVRIFSKLDFGYKTD